jgi:protein kinase-like protein
MNRRSFPSAQTSSAVLKGLLRALLAEKGAGAADAWLRGIRMVGDDLDDETRQVPLATVHRALVSFAEAVSRDAIVRVSKYLILPDSLGVWVRILRGTAEPEGAFARLDATDSQHGRTTRWDTLASRPGRWRGRVTIAHDPSMEHDGLLRLARLAELAAVPALFGYSAVVARSISDTNRPAGIVQEFEVSWTVPRTTSSGLVGAAIGFGIGLVPLATHLVVAPFGWPLLAASTGLAGIGGVLRARDLLRQAENHAQQMRVHVLERGLSLKELHDRSEGGLEGTVVAGQYRVIRRMGSGATGVIYEAARISDGLPVAMKLLRAAAAHDAVASDRLRREAEALGLAWHPNVVEVIDHGHLADGTAYLVMELLRGESLAARVKAKGRLRPRELLPIALDVCSALAAVHAAGVVHRDLKPSNIFLSASHRDEPAGLERVKLLDFGIARVEWEETRITNTGGPLGTPGYMSPEQEAGSGEIDARSDLFALGALLFECLVGEPPPPQTPSGLVRMQSQSSGRLDSGTQRAAAFVPPVWRAIIDKAMAASPADRYPDARSFGAALRGIEAETANVEASS